MNSELNLLLSYNECYFDLLQCLHLRSSDGPFRKLFTQSS